MYDINHQSCEQQLQLKNVANQQIANSHGGDGRLQGFYCTTYGSAFSRVKLTSPFFVTGSFPDSGWSHECRSQPEKYCDTFHDKVKDNDSIDESQTTTVYSSDFHAPRRYDGDLPVFYPVNHSSYPEMKTNNITPTENTKQCTKSWKSVYKTETSDVPKDWMTERLYNGAEMYPDTQSAYLKNVPYHNLFVYPETMQTDAQYSHLGKTSYQETFDKSILNKFFDDRCAGKSVPAVSPIRTQFDGTHGVVAETVTGKDPERWKTSYSETFEWTDWRNTENVNRLKRPFGTPKFISSGFVQNEPDPHLYLDPIRNDLTSLVILSPDTSWTTTYTKEFPGEPHVKECGATGHARAFAPPGKVIVNTE